jgi:hypothetical protein
MKLIGAGKVRDATEVRGADELPPGPYWALYVCGERRGTGWLELVKHRPSRDGKVVLGPGGGLVTSPSGREAAVYGVVVITEDRSVRFPTDAERIAAGRLMAVADPPVRA